MKTSFKLLLAVLFVFCSQAFPQNWSLIWSDEFEGISIDKSIWIHESGGGGWGNNELQYYTNREDNSYIEDGKLVIKAIKES